MIKTLIDRVNQECPGKGDALFGGFVIYRACIPVEQLMSTLNITYGLNYPVGEEHVEDWINNFIEEILPGLS